MPDAPFQVRSRDDQRDALQVAAGRSGRPACPPEKDIWVVRTLRLGEGHGSPRLLSLATGTRRASFQALA